MEELLALINRTELAAQHAEASGFHDTAQALKTIVAALRQPDDEAPRANLFQFTY
jgi:hypothetical protein